MASTPLLSSFPFLGCTWASSLSLSGMHPHLLPLFCGIYSHHPILGDTLISSSFFFFLWDTLTQLLFFPGNTHTNPSPSVGCTTLFVLDLPTHLPLQLFSGMHSCIPSSSFAGCTPHLLSLGCTPTSSSSFFFLQDTPTQVLLLWDGLTDLFFFSGCTQASLFFPTPPTSSFARTIPCTSSRIPTAQPAPKVGPKTPSEDVRGKISREGIWGREQSLGNASQSNPTPGALI